VRGWVDGASIMGGGRHNYKERVVRVSQSQREKITKVGHSDYKTQKIRGVEKSTKGKGQRQKKQVREVRIAVSTRRRKKKPQGERKKNIRMKIGGQTDKKYVQGDKWIGLKRTKTGKGKITQRYNRESKVRLGEVWSKLNPDARPGEGRRNRPRSPCVNREKNRRPG